VEAGAAAMRPLITEEAEIASLCGVPGEVWQARLSFFVRLPALTYL